VSYASTSRSEGPWWREPTKDNWYAVVAARLVPDGSRFKGHAQFLVQDLVISVRATCYPRERWATPDGRTILAPPPEGIDGHFGPELRRFVLMQYHQGQSTPPRLGRSFARWASRSQSVSCSAC
jgi:hypothetical protein